MLVWNNFDSWQRWQVTCLRGVGYSPRYPMLSLSAHAATCSVCFIFWCNSVNCLSHGCLLIIEACPHASSSTTFYLFFPLSQDPTFFLCCLANNYVLELLCQHAIKGPPHRVIKMFSWRTKSLHSSLSSVTQVYVLVKTSAVEVPCLLMLTSIALSLTSINRFDKWCWAVSKGVLRGRKFGRLT